VWGDDDDNDLLIRASQEAEHLVENSLSAPENDNIQTVDISVPTNQSDKPMFIDLPVHIQAFHLQTLRSHQPATIT